MDRDNLPFDQSAPLWVWLLTLLAIAVIMGCDLQGAQVTAEQIQMAEEKKQELPPHAYFDNPLGTTWILQAGNDADGNQIIEPRRRYSFTGDLTKRGK